MAVTAPRHQAILANLLVNRNSTVSCDQLTEALWPAQPPLNPANQIAICIGALRRMIREAGGPAAAIETRRPGYRLHVGEHEIDTDVAQTLLQRARQDADAGRTAMAAATLRTALDLWRGPVLFGITSPSVASSVALWEERRLATGEEWARLELELGRHHELIPPLRRWVADHPLREHLRGQLMVALYRAGRKPEALALFHEARHLLNDSLGLDPGPELRDLHNAILVDALPASEGSDPGPDGTVPTDQHAVIPVAAHPRMLPADTPDLCGRRRELARLRALLTGQADRPPAVATVSGQPGVGKSTLVVHAAHQLAKDFPDGQLYVDLQDTGAAALEPAEVLRTFLRELGVPDSAVPDETGQRAGIYRSILARRRMLVVLDNATGEAQIQPLLPGSSTCGVLVTSQAALTALDGAGTIRLDPLDDGDATALLTRLVGGHRVRAEPEAARRVVRFCAGLPLAIRAAAARLTARPHWSIARFAARLAERRLDELSHGSLHVRERLALSYRLLDEPAQRLVRCLALLGDTDFTPPAGAALLDVDVAEVEELFEQLVEAHLLDITTPDGGGFRYRFHDLVRLYAQELVADHEPGDGRHSSGRPAGWPATTPRHLSVDWVATPPTVGRLPGGRQAAAVGSS